MSDVAPQNFTMAAGDSRVLEVTVRDLAGAPVALAGLQSATWRLAPTERDPFVLNKTIGAGINVLTTQAGIGEINCGRLDVLITETDSEPLDGEYFHDLHLVDASGAHSTVLKGRANFIPNLT